MEGVSMNKKNWKRFLSVALLAFLVLALALSIPHAAKGFGDFDSRSDFGGSGSGSSSRNSSDSDSDGVDLYMLFRLATFVGRLFGIESPAVSVVLTLVIFFGLKFAFSALKKKEGQSSRHEDPEHGDGFNPDSLRRLQEADPSFDGEALLQRVRDLYEKMQFCWEEGNIDPLRKDFMPDAWTRFNTQLQNKCAAGETSHVRNIQFGQVALQSWSAGAEHQILRIRFDVTQNIWTTNAEGKCTLGTEKTRKRFEFVWTMTRPLESVTGGAPSADADHCPNCGAEIDMESFAECPFCHTPFMKVSPDWVISEIDALSQQTLRG